MFSSLSGRLRALQTGFARQYAMTMVGGALLIVADGCGGHVGGADAAREAIGALVDAIREALDPWLGDPRWKRGAGRFTLGYRFNTSFEPVATMRLKVEINTREHFSILGIGRRTFAVKNPWFQGEADIPTYELEDLLGTKMRALFQRKKGRDLFDLWLALGSTDANLIFTLTDRGRLALVWGPMFAGAVVLFARPRTVPVHVADDVDPGNLV